MPKRSFSYTKQVIGQLTKLMTVLRVKTVGKVSFVSELNAGEANRSIQRKWPIN